MMDERKHIMKFVRSVGSLAEQYGINCSVLIGGKSYSGRGESAYSSRYDEWNRLDDINRRNMANWEDRGDDCDE